MKVKVAAASDLHGILPQVPPCDLLLLGGDLCPGWDHSCGFQADWLDTDFRKWLEKVPAKKIVAVAGNHDFVWEQIPEIVPQDLPWTYLQDSGCEWEGLKIWGSPHQKKFGGWAFNLNECDLEEKWDLIPDDTDILILHGPPFGYGDLTIDLRREGSPSLTERIKQVKPKLAIWGHIHEARGQWKLGKTILANVSLSAGRFDLPIWQTELD